MHERAESRRPERLGPVTLNQREFEDFLQEHRGIVFKIANTYCPEGEERDDLVQEICLQLWRSYARYDVRRRFSTWMYRVALNTAISFARGARARQRRIVPLDDSGAGARAEAVPPREEDERVARLYRFLHGLGELDRALVLAVPRGAHVPRDRRRARSQRDQRGHQDQPPQTDDASRHRRRRGERTWMTT